MDDAELCRLLFDLESDRVERTASAKDGEKLRQAICAFANDLPNHRQPGVLFVGAHDDGSPAGLAITDELLRGLSDIRSDGNILPLPAMTVEKRNLAGNDLAVIIVQPADAPPVRYKGRVWVRVGPRKAIASAQEERLLSEKRRSNDLPFDLQPAAGAELDDLDRLLFEQEYLPAAVPAGQLAENQRTYEQKLTSLRFLSPKSGVPTNLGVLVLGKDPRRVVPGAYVQFLRVAGADLLRDPIKDEKPIDGPLGTMLRLLDETLRTNIFVASSGAVEPIETRRPDYPLIALQQIARNAILHRTYEHTNNPVRITWFDDRIEIQSPGGPYGQVNAQNFGQPGVTDYRNPHLAEAMKTLGFVQRFGTGILLARRELEKNGNPPPEFVVDHRNVMVIVRRAG